MEYTGTAFDFAKHILKKYKTREETIDVVLNALNLYMKCQITDDELLQVLQWLPEEQRVMIWRGYKISNIRCK